MKSRNWLKQIYERVAFSLFLLCVLFWLSMALNCFYGYARSGLPGIRDTVLHVLRVPRTRDADSRWDLVMIDFATIAATTVLSGIASKQCALGNPAACGIF